MCGGRNTRSSNNMEARVEVGRRRRFKPSGFFAQDTKAGFEVGDLLIELRVGWHEQRNVGGGGGDG